MPQIRDDMFQCGVPGKSHSRRRLRSRGTDACQHLSDPPEDHDVVFRTGGFFRSQRQKTDPEKSNDASLYPGLYSGDHIHVCRSGASAGPGRHGDGAGKLQYGYVHDGDRDDPGGY